MGVIDMVEGKYLYYGNDLSYVFDIRKNVLIKELKLEESKVFDNDDKEAIHALVYVDNKPTATGRLIIFEDTYVIDKVCVLKEERRKKYGDFVVRMLIDKAFLQGAEEIIIKVQIELYTFFEKFGFLVIEDKYRKYEKEIKEVKENDEDIKKCITMYLKKGNICKICNKMYK